jgi:hypothetical protein
LTVQTTLSAGVLRVGLARPEKKNALSLSMYEALNAAFDQAQREREVKVLLIHGLPEVFTAGNDLEDFLKQPMDEHSPVLGFLRRLATCEKPLMAAVNGFAVGIGTTLLLHCDLVYAADDAKFALPFVNLGLCPEAGSSWLLPRLAGHAQAARSTLAVHRTVDGETLSVVIVHHQTILMCHSDPGGDHPARHRRKRTRHEQPWPRLAIPGAFGLLQQANCAHRSFLRSTVGCPGMTNRAFSTTSSPGDGPSVATACTRNSIGNDPCSKPF